MPESATAAKRHRDDGEQKVEFSPVRHSRALATHASSCLDEIRRSTARVMSLAKHVTIDEEALKAEISDHAELYKIPPDLDWAPEGYTALDCFVYDVIVFVIFVDVTRLLT